MEIGMTLIDQTDWSRLSHAYGRATDTPAHLRALIQEDTESRENAMSHLWSAIIHQGTPWTATKPVALVVAGLLTDDSLQIENALQASLVSFLVAVAEAPAEIGLSLEELQAMAEYDIVPFINSLDDDAIYENEDAANSLYARSILGCVEIAPVLYETMINSLSSPSQRVRACAAMGAATLAQVDNCKVEVRELVDRLNDLANASTDSDERSAHVLALGELGVEPTSFLEDSSPAVRMCAALAPGLFDHPQAVRELIVDLEEHASDIDDWFTEKPPQFAMRPRFSVILRLIQNTKNFDEIVNAAIAVLKVTSRYCVDYEWGPLLATAFKDGTGAITSKSQLRFLTELVNHEELWDKSFGNPLKWFRKAGLEYDREICRRLVKQSSL